MNFPFQIGLPQVVLLLIVLVGLWLFITALTGLVRRYEIHELKEEEKKAGMRAPRRWGYGRLRWKRGGSGILLLIIAISLLWLTFLVQTYLGLTGDIRVARIHATATNIPHLMSVEVILYDNNGNPASDKTYIVQGDEWMLQGDIVKFPSWLNILGLHSGFKLTRLEGRYDDVNMERTAPHTVIELNGGDDNFFKTVQAQAWTSPFVDSAYGSSTFLSPDNHTYDIFVSQDALHPEPVK
ncbi:MAG TPA: hypothetical protein VGT44_23445 [Ktedonobacteraceae bacterium]|nr:hypothetical protein [Ktedonobacteraceae bacterium]